MAVPRTLLGKLVFALVAAALLLILVGCEQTFAPTDDGALTREEVAALAAFMGIQSLDFAATRRAAPVATADTVRVEYNVPRPCPLGGSVRSSGTVQVVTEQGPPTVSVVDVAATEVHDACVFLVAPTRIAVTGDPDVTTTVHVAERDGEPWGLQSVRVVGGVRWEADDGRNGRCDLDVDIEVDPDAHRQVARGTFCGYALDVVVTGG